jgi:23S rRNA (cytidine1920-2'-O)/16S rRNA (cytidine1409-2'-O)-methyltransferase
MRLDTLVHQRGLAESREKARRLILAGQVLVDGHVLDKAGRQVDESVDIEVRHGLPYVGRGGFKLAQALDAFGIDPAGCVAADVGASTGGFTDCLLQRGAARVYAIDVGYGQLHWALRQDPRVVVMERTNARYLEELPEPIDLVTIDVSFISLRLILPMVERWLRPDGDVVALVKPQFEAGADSVGRGGIVRDTDTHRDVLCDIIGWASAHGWVVAGLGRSPITGAKGNIEFLVWLKRHGTPVADIERVMASVLADDE